MGIPIGLPIGIPIGMPTVIPTGFPTGWPIGIPIAIAITLQKGSQNVTRKNITSGPKCSPVGAPGRAKFIVFHCVTVPNGTPEGLLF